MLGTGLFGRVCSELSELELALSEQGLFHHTFILNATSINDCRLGRGMIYKSKLRSIEKTNLLVFEWFKAKTKRRKAVRPKGVLPSLFYLEDLVRISMI